MREQAAAPCRAAQTQIIIVVARHRDHHHNNSSSRSRVICLLIPVRAVVVVRGVSWVRCLAASHRLTGRRRLLLNNNKGMVDMDSSNSNIRHSSSMEDQDMGLRSHSMGTLLKAGIRLRVDIILLLVLDMAVTALALDTDIRLNSNSNRVNPAQGWAQWVLLR